MYHAALRISGYRLPSAVEFRAALPRPLVGKVLRRVLVEGAQEPEDQIVIAQCSARVPHPLP